MTTYAIANEMITESILDKTLYVGFLSAEPQRDGTYAELSGGAYARVSMSGTTPVNGAFSNDALVVFPQATSNWTTITFVGVFDAPTGGNLLFWAVPPSPINVNNTDVAQFQANQLNFVVN